MARPAICTPNLPGHVEGLPQAAAAGDGTQRLEHVDADVEGAQQAGQPRRDAAAALGGAAAEAQRGDIDADRHRQDQLAVLELRLGQRDGGALQRQRAQRQRIRAGGGRGHGRHREDLVDPGGGDRGGAAADTPAAGDDLDLTSPATKVSFGSTPVRGVSR
jgi:hypothetical protein